MVDSSLRRRVHEISNKGIKQCQCCYSVFSAKPRIIKYRDYKHFDNNEVREELIRDLVSNNVQSDDLAQFINISKIILGKKETSLKVWYVRYKYNQGKFMNKKLAKSNYQSFQVTK